MLMGSEGNLDLDGLCALFFVVFFSLSALAFFQQAVDVCEPVILQWEHSVFVLSILHSLAR